MGLIKILPKGLLVAALAMLLVACETAPSQMGGAGGFGAGAGREAVPGTQDDLAANVGDRVFFDYDRYELKAEGRATLDRQAAWLKRYPQNRIVIEGHCDERGTREYNLALGEQRANAAKQYLINQGIAASRLETISYGKERPVALGSNEAAWAQNRRAVSVVAGSAGA
jgi:peptidoglycan-associated lipoprotein